MTTRILVADDHVVVRRGLRLIIDAEPDLEVVAEAEDGLEAIRVALAMDVDLAILDINMPHKTGLEATRELNKQRPSIKTLILSMYNNEEFLYEALRSGASGYVLKSQADQDIVNACRAAIEDEPFVYPEAMAELVRELLAGDSDRTEALTPRELEVVKLIADGKSSKEIAQMLVISLKTVESHRANILRKLGMRDRVELTKYAIRRGLTEA
jgi:DNA-binding NarL/FixJ family response regulator